MLTGESVAVRPDEGATLLCGSFVVEGEGEGVVLRTGTRTRLAGISALTAKAVRRPSPLTLQLHKVVVVVSVVAVTTGATLFAVAVALGMPVADGFLFAIGVTVALVPEGLLPTVTMSLALGAQKMADRHALVRRLEAVESLGATTVICTDKTGTLTRNQMSVVAVWTPGAGGLSIPATGYDPSPPLSPGDAVSRLASAAAACVRGRLVPAPEGAAGWVPEGDPMEVALDVLARRVGLPRATVLRWLPYTADRRRSSAVAAASPGQTPLLAVLGAPESVLPQVLDGVAAQAAGPQVEALASRGLRVLAVAGRAAPDGWAEAAPGDLETGLSLYGLVALADPPRPDVRDAIDACETAAIHLVMITGDHPLTAAAIAREVGLLHAEGRVVPADALPADDAQLAALLTSPGGTVVARVSPEDKLRIALALRSAGHVVAMTGDGVNDAPALRAADVGVAMGASGSDVAREAADLVLLDDHFSTIVGAVELGRATTANIRRFLTYHLTDNVAELTPFVAWALTGGSFPLAIGVLQVLALDIGTDVLPALALGTEKANPSTLKGPAHSGSLIDRRVLGRAFGVLGPAEAVGSLATFTAVLVAGGWGWGREPDAALLATASGSAFAAIAVGQLANAVACRSAGTPAWRMGLAGNRTLQWAVLFELALCGALLGVPPVADQLGGTWPSALGWFGAAATGAAVVLVDGAHKNLRRTVTPVHARPARPARPGPGAPQKELR